MTYLLRHWKLAIVAVLLLALTAVWWMYRAEIERRVDMAIRAGEIQQQLDRAERVLRMNARLQRRVEEIRAESRREVRQAEERLRDALEEDAEAGRWARERVPDAVRDWLLNDADDSDADAPAVRAPGDRGGHQPGSGQDDQAPGQGDRGVQ